MICPKCGYYMDAFSSSCPRCARLGPAETPPAAPVSPNARPTVPSYAARSKTAPRTGSTAMSFEVKQLVAIICSVAVLVSIFLPVISIPLFGDISLFRLGKIFPGLSYYFSETARAHSTFKEVFQALFLHYLWIILLVLAVATILFTVLKQYRVIWGTASVTLVLALVVFISYIVQVAKANAEYAEATANTFNYFTVLPLGFGAILLLIGGIMLFSACFLDSPEG